MVIHFDLKGVKPRGSKGKCVDWVRKKPKHGKTSSRNSSGNPLPQGYPQPTGAVPPQMDFGQPMAGFQGFQSFSSPQQQPYIPSPQQPYIPPPQQPVYAAPPPGNSGAYHGLASPPPIGIGSPRHPNLYPSPQAPAYNAAPQGAPPPHVASPYASSRASSRQPPAHPTNPPASFHHSYQQNSGYNPQRAPGSVRSSSSDSSTLRSYSTASSGRQPLIREEHHTHIKEYRSRKRP